MQVRIFIFVFVLSSAGLEKVYSSTNLLHDVEDANMSGSAGEFDPHLVIDGEYSQDRIFCIQTESRVKEAWWQVTLRQRSIINRVELYSKDDDENTQFQSMKKLAGFSIYVSNSSRVPSGKRCYHHEGKDYPELYQDVTCDAIGKYITVIVTRPPETPSGEICYTSYAVLELCEVDVHGCPVGYYGEDCFRECPNNCISNLCDPDTGNCIYGCSENKFGPKCEQDCREDDQTCTRTCIGHCVNNNCDGVGVCLGSCEAGWSGITCEMECGPDFFGENCEHQCNCHHGECDKKNGTCPDEECLEGWIPPTCSQLALAQVAPDGMVQSTTFNTVVTVSVIANVFLLGILATVFWKFKLINRIPKAKQIGSIPKRPKSKSTKKILETVQYDDLKETNKDRKTNDYSQHLPRTSGNYLEPSAPNRGSKSSVYNNDEMEDIYYSIT